MNSILNPSAAVGYNFRSHAVALKDGQVLTGLVVEDTPDRLVLKTSDGKRAEIKPGEIDERKVMEISLMPEGLAQQMREQDLVDVLAYLGTLRRPVSIVGQYSVLGPVEDSADHPAIDPAKPLDAKDLTSRRLTANAEGVADLAPVVGADAGKSAYLLTPVTSRSDQEVRLVLDTAQDVRAWIGGKPVAFSAPSAGEPRSATVALAKGTTDLIIRVPGGDAPRLVATIVSDEPVEFSPSEAAR